VSPAFTALRSLTLAPHECLGLLAEGQGQGSLTAGQRPAMAGEGAGRILQGALGLWLLLLPRLQARVDEVHRGRPQGTRCQSGGCGEDSGSSGPPVPPPPSGKQHCGSPRAPGAPLSSRGKGGLQAFQGASTLVSFELGGPRPDSGAGLPGGGAPDGVPGAARRGGDVFLAAAFQSFQSLLPAPALASSRLDQGRGSGSASMGAQGLGRVWWSVAVELACAAAEAADTSAPPAPSPAASRPAPAPQHRALCLLPWGAQGTSWTGAPPRALSDQASARLAEVDDPNHLRPILLTINGYGLLRTRARACALSVIYKNTVLQYHTVQYSTVCCALGAPFFARGKLAGLGNQGKPRHDASCGCSIVLA